MASGLLALVQGNALLRGPALAGRKRQDKQRDGWKAGGGGSEHVKILTNLLPVFFQTKIVFLFRLAVN